MRAAKFEQGKFYAVASIGSKPGDGCERMIYVMPWGRKYLFISADADDEDWTDEEARRAADREERRIIGHDYAPSGWLVTERAVACLWEDYPKWQISHEYRSAAAINAREEKRLREMEAEKVKRAAETEARLATPLGQLEKRMETFVGVRHAHVFQGYQEDFKPDEPIVMGLSIRFKNLRAIEGFIARMEREGLLKVRQPVIDVETED